MTSFFKKSSTGSVLQDMTNLMSFLKANRRISFPKDGGETSHLDFSLVEGLNTFELGFLMYFFNSMLINKMNLDALLLRRHERAPSLTKRLWRGCLNCLMVWVIVPLYIVGICRNIFEKYSSAKRRAERATRSSKRMKRQEERRCFGHCGRCASNLVFFLCSCPYLVLPVCCLAILLAPLIVLALVVLRLVDNVSFVHLNVPYYDLYGVPFLFCDEPLSEMDDFCGDRRNYTATSSGISVANLFVQLRSTHLQSQISN